MLAEDLYGLRETLRREGIMFAYSGYVTESVLTGVGEALKQKLTIEDMDTKTLRSVFAVFVEQMQNIIRYSAEREPSAAEAAKAPQIRYGILTIGRSEEGVFVKAGNLVERSDVARLRQKLDQVRNADRSALKAMYKEILRTGPDEGSKGAGVGFIEIARRASRPIDFDFTDVDGHYAFFALHAVI